MPGLHALSRIVWDDSDFARYASYVGQAKKTKPGFILSTEYPANGSSNLFHSLRVKEEYMVKPHG